MTLYSYTYFLFHSILNYDIIPDGLIFAAIFHVHSAAGERLYVHFVSKGSVMITLVVITPAAVSGVHPAGGVQLVGSLYCARKSELLHDWPYVSAYLECVVMRQDESTDRMSLRF